ncbi:exodeoxyribonuclease VII small subunit [Corynebacterium sp. TAE3-ERU12]|uniref:exodeoxyribonuclease VII small subunit n=1 Tax=Corynebacterium sp. TAE3-ERU12 TaxID=2849491 RepID=UPI001C466E2D|nr:exodeoxyribonuclease VII small subunit [Corynebacterium sp. TAE3-ERU12]MBV7295717.1 exodeoxyribonuclease VII small subunit [Corynebacterium sp. TAE3-ERU12]
MSDIVFGSGTGSNEEQKPVEQLSYEAARDELIETVKLLEQGQLDLDASLELWERGEALARRCEEQLAGAKERIEATIAKADGDNASPIRAD